MELTPKQLAVFEKLELGVYSFTDLSTDERALLSETLRANGSFTAQQRALLHGWYLQVTPEQVSAANAALPTDRAIFARADTEGALWLNADLLTDCARPGDTYHSITSTLVQLKLVKLDESNFPAAEAIL